MRADQIMIFAVLLMLWTPVVLWFFWIRPYVRKHGATTVTAANWGLSALADWTTAWDISRDEGHTPWFLSTFILLEGTYLLILLGAFVASGITTQ